MKSDKELIRLGNYQEALGSNYSIKPFYMIDLTDSSFSIVEDLYFYSKFDLKEKATELGILSYIIGNLNSEWL